MANAVGSLQIFRDNNSSNFLNSLSLQIPNIDISQINPSAFTPTPKGKICLNIDGNIYYSDGNSWIQLTNANNSVWEHETIENIVRLSANNPDYDTTESLVFPGQSISDGNNRYRFNF